MACAAAIMRVDGPCECTPPAPYGANGNAFQGRLPCGMFEYRCQLRVRYAETDRMGYVYYGAYAGFLEVARVEALRSLGLSYRAMEDEGVMLPVHDLSLRYHKPAFYDDLLTITTRVAAPPSVRIAFDYTVHNEQGDALTDASTTLVFIDRATGRPCRAPRRLLDVFAPYFP